MPKEDFSKPQPKKRRAPATAPEYHLTGERSMKFIEEADQRKKEKTANEAKLNNIKVEAVKKAKAEEKKQNKGTTTGRSRSKKAIKANPKM